MESSEPDRAFHLLSHHCRVEGQERLPLPAGIDFSKASLCAADFLCHKDTLLTHGQLGVCQTSQFFFAKPTWLHGPLCGDISPFLQQSFPAGDMFGIFSRISVGWYSEERKALWKDVCVETNEEIDLSYFMQKKNAIFPESKEHTGQTCSEWWR